MKTYLIALLIAVVMTSCFQHSEVFKNEDGAISGYDPVAYFKVGQPVPGRKEYVLEWKGAEWYFSSAENKSLFEKDPEQYAPQYGGYCAYGTAGGYKAPTQPDAWTIVDDKLYLNYNKEVQAEWTKDRDSYIKKANSNWPTVKNLNE